MSWNRLFIASGCLAGFLLAVPAAVAQEPLACQNTLSTRLDAAADLPVYAAAGDKAIELAAGEFEASLGEPPTARASGGVLLRRGDRLAGADEAYYDPEDFALHLRGDVRFEDSSTQVLGDTAEFSYRSGRVQFTGAEFTLGMSNSRGAADRLLITQQGLLELDNVSYTTCPPGSNDWLLEAGDIDLDTRQGTGTAKNIKLRFQNVPILWAPYISFPLGDARKTGVLTPEVGSSDRSGTEITVPFYLNIAPNYDATITPRLLTKRGLELQTEFRYLTEAHNGNATIRYLPDDSVVNDTRSLVSLQHRSDFRSGIRNLIDFREVSDSQYFEDLGGSLSLATVTNLNRSLSFDWHTDTLSVFTQVQDFQNLDDAILPTDEPYQRVPQIVANGYWPERLGNIALGVDTEIVNFDREIGVTGWRVNFAPRIEIPFERPGWFVNPAVAYDFTRYELDNTGPGEDTSRKRDLPIASLDAGMIFERAMNGDGLTRRVQTLEPRVLYVNIPFRDQDDLPVFDTITPDLNLVQLFRKNRFLGVDRIGDTDQVSLGITSRVLDLSTGREQLAVTVGQTRYLSDRRVTLPGGVPDSSESSDYIAELRFLLLNNINFDVGHQWGTSGSGTTRSEARLQWMPAGNKILNLAYRFRRDSLEQGDLSWSWPVGRQWNFVGRYNYSFRDRQALEQFFGLEFESCCWGLRVVSRRFISTRDGTRDSSVGLQLVLKGMTAVGTAADKLLERGILGYSANLR